MIRICFISVWLGFLSLEAFSQALPNAYMTQWTWSPVTTLQKKSHAAKLDLINQLESELTLAAHGTAYIELPKSHWLRLTINTKNNDDNKLLFDKTSRYIWQSIGNGLYLPSHLIVEKNQPTTQKNTGLIRGHDRWTTLFKIQNPINEPIKLNISMAKARSLPYKKSFHFNQVEPLNIGHQDWHYLSSQKQYMQLKQYTDNETITLDLQGPGSWKLETRLLYDNQDWQRFIDIPISLNNEYWINWRLHPSIDHSGALHNSQCNVLTSYPETYHFSLPAGHHRLTFSAPQSMFLRLLKNDEEPYLISKNSHLKNSDSTTIRNLTLKENFFDHEYGNQFEFDNAILNGFYSGSITQKDIETALHSESQLNKPSNYWLHHSSVFKEIIQRYQRWKPLTITHGIQTPNKAWLVPIKPIDPKKDTDRYIRKSKHLDINLNNLINIKQNSYVELHAPSKKDTYQIRLQLPIYSTDFDLTIIDRHGNKQYWQWRPEHLSVDQFEIQSGKHLTELYSTGQEYTDQAWLTVAGEMTLNANDFPIRLSHNANHEILFSPFYKDVRHFSLDQNSWERAVNTLGRKHILTLLTNDQNVQTSRHPLLEKKISQDLIPIKEWLFHSRQTWSVRLNKTNDSNARLQHESIDSLARRLSKKGEYKLLTDILKGIAIQDSNTARRSQAMKWLYEYYVKNDDSIHLNAYHSWQFSHNPEQHLPILANWLIKQGQSKLALRLYSLFKSDEYNLSKYYTILKHYWLPSNSTESSLHALWQSIWKQDWDQALRHSQNLKQSDKWQGFMKAIPHHDHQEDPIKWLAWLQSSPDSNVSVPVTLLPKKQAGSALVYNDLKKKGFQLANAQPNDPIEYEIIGPVDVQFHFRLQHKNTEPNERLNDWVEINHHAQKTKWFPIFHSRISDDLSLVPNHIGSPGSIKQLNVSFGPGLHTLKIKALSSTLLVNANIHTPVLFSELMDEIQNGHLATNYFTSNLGAKTSIQDQPMSASEKLKNTPIHQLGLCIDNPLENFLNDNDYASTVNWQTPDEGDIWQAPHTLQSIQSSWSIPSKVITADENSLEQTLLNILWHWPDIIPENQAKIVAHINHLVQGMSLSSHVRALMNQLNRPYTWEKENLIISSAGTKKINQFIESDFLNERQHLIFQGNTVKGERLYGHNQFGLMLDFNKKTQIRLKFSQMALPFQYAPDSTLLITLNQKEIKTVTLSDKQAVINLSIPAGRQQLRVKLLEPSSDHWIYIQADAYILDQWVNVIQPRSTKFYVSTHDQPLVLHLNQTRWLRIEEYKNDKTIQTYQLKKDSGTLTLKPEKGQNAALYRVFSFQEKTSSQPLLPISIEKEPFDETLRYTDTQLLSKSPLFLPEYSADTNNKNRTSTNGLYYQHSIRYDFDDLSSDQPSQTYNEFGWRHRRPLNCLSCYWRSDVYGRSHSDTETQLIGATLWMQGDMPYSNNWSWRTKQELLYSHTYSDAWRWAGSGNLINSYTINESIALRHNLELFAQHLSFTPSNLPQDTDLYSQYKRDHTWGIKVEESLHYRPWLDSLLSGHFRLVSNELETTIEPDYLQAGFAWHQYWQPMQFSVNYRHRTYLVDQQRDDTHHQPTLGLNIKFWHHFNGQDLIQYQARLNRNLNNQDYIVTFEISWNMANSMGFHHFMPSENAFHSLKRDAFNHEINRHFLSQEAKREE